MLSDERISVDERRKYLKLVAPRYARADGKRRSGLHVSLSCYETPKNYQSSALQRLMSD